MSRILRNIVYCYIIAVFLHKSIILADDSKTITSQEKLLIKKLRERLKKEFTQDIQSYDAYLIRFIRARNHNLENAETMFKKHLDWRKEQKIDNILKEDWSEWERKYPYNLKLFDYEGRPALTTKLGQIDIRRLVLAGKGNDLNRYLTYGFERGLVNINKVSNQTKKMFIDGHLLFNMAGYNTRIHACLACIPSWINMIQVYERYYPQLCRTIISINSPRIFNGLLDILKPFLTPHTSSIISIYDVDKSVWSRELIKIFPRNLLAREFGGTEDFFSLVHSSTNDIKRQA